MFPKSTTYIIIFHCHVNHSDHLKHVLLECTNNSQTGGQIIFLSFVNFKTRTTTNQQIQFCFHLSNQEAYFDVTTGQGFHQQ